MNHLPQRRWLALGALLLLVAGLVAFVVVRQTGLAAADGQPLMSMGVLPFKSANGADGDAFAEKFTRELTAAVGRSALRWGTIIVPTNAATGAHAQQTDARALGQQLGVRYLAAGEVGRDGDDVVSSLSLVDALTARQVWSARIATPLSKVSEWPELPVLRAAYPLRAALFNTEKQRLPTRATHDAGPAELLARFNMAVDAAETQAELAKAKGLCDQLVRLDPGLAVAAFCQAVLIYANATFDPDMVNAKLVQKFDGLTRQAIQQAPSDASVWSVRSDSLELQHQREAMDDAMAEAIWLDPASATYRALRAENMIYLGRAEAALPLLARAAELNTDPAFPFYELVTCHALLSLGRYDEAVGHCEKMTGRAPNFWVYVVLATIYAQRGDTAKAVAAKDKALGLRTELTIAWFKAWVQRTSNHPVYQEQIEAHFLPGLRKAGFAEK